MPTPTETVQDLINVPQLVNEHAGVGRVAVGSCRRDICRYGELRIVPSAPIKLESATALCVFSDAFAIPTIRFVRDTLSQIVSARVPLEGPRPDDTGQRHYPSWRVHLRR